LHVFGDSTFAQAVYNGGKPPHDTHGNLRLFKSNIERVGQMKLEDMGKVPERSVGARATFSKSNVDRSNVGCEPAC
jgi:hypothetical protein